MVKIQVILILFLTFYDKNFVTGKFEKCSIWNKILKCNRSFNHHKYCYETKPYKKTVCCREIKKFNTTEELINIDLNKYCIIYKEIEYELLLKKLYGIFGILVLSIIVGILIYFCRQNDCLFQSQNGRLLFVVQHQEQSQQQEQTQTNTETAREDEENYFLWVSQFDQSGSYTKLLHWS